MRPRRQNADRMPKWCIFSLKGAPLISSRLTRKALCSVSFQLAPTNVQVENLHYWVSQFHRRLHMKPLCSVSFQLALYNVQVENLRYGRAISDFSPTPSCPTAFNRRRSNKLPNPLSHPAPARQFPPLNTPRGSLQCRCPAYVWPFWPVFSYLDR
jgi:hypothetical protein